MIMKLQTSPLLGHFTNEHTKKGLPAKTVCSCALLCWETAPQVCLGPPPLYIQVAHRCADTTALVWATFNADRFKPCILPPQHHSIPMYVHPDTDF